MRRNDFAATAVNWSANVRRGVTLVELLVVIALLMMITAVTVPAVAPAIRQRKQREAARLVSSYIASARSRAMETGRPVAVVIERFNPGLSSSTLATAQQAAANQAALTANLQPFSLYLSTAESPLPYSGDFVASTIDVVATPNPNPPPQWPWSASSTPPYASNPLYPSQVAMVLRGPAADNWQAQRIRIGDGIRFNYQGPIYYFDGANMNTNGLITLATPYVAPTYTLASPDTSPPQFWTAGLMPDSNAANGGLGVWTITSPNFVGGAGVPYQIFRQPITTAAVAPQQLPEGVVIDIEASGMGPLGLFSASTTTSPIISFNPDGTMNLVYDGLPKRPTGTIFLLIGRREQVPLVATSFIPATANIQDPNSLWVTINAQTGQVATFENYVPTGGANNISNYGPNGNLTDTSSIVVGSATYQVGVPRTHASGSYAANYTSPLTTTGGN